MYHEIRFNNHDPQCRIVFCRPIVEYLDFPKEFMDNLYNIPFCEIDSLKGNGLEETSSDTQSNNLPVESPQCDGEGGHSSQTNGKNKGDNEAVMEVCDQSTESTQNTNIEGEESGSPGPAKKKMKTEVNI